MNFFLRINLNSIVKNNLLKNGFNNFKTSQLYCTVTEQCNETPLKLPHDEKDYSDKIKKIVNDISKLTLLEVCDLNKLIKKTFNIPDVPMMAMQGSLVKEEKKDDEVEVSKSEYMVKLVKFEPSQKVALIKEVKGLLEGMNLVQAKKFVESIPQVLKNDVPKEEAEVLKSKLEKVGATVILI